MSRQTVKEHVDRLVAAGLVVARPVGKGRVQEYVVDHSAIFLWSEELRSLARLRPLAGPDAATLPAMAKNGDNHAIQGPCLVLVHGLDEGERFDLSPQPGRSEEQWIMGRRADLQVPLDFDPYVSGEHAVIERRGNDYFVSDLDSNQNGTWLNFRPLARGDEHRLEHGDLIGAGLCLLMFRA